MFTETNPEVANNLPRVINRISSGVQRPQSQNPALFLLKCTVFRIVIQKAIAGLREVFTMP